LKDGSLVLVEIQKVPYYFPAERASCYSADLLLRQYSSIRSKKGKRFSYKDLRKVYTIVLYEKSTEEFKTCSDAFVHHARTVCDTGLELNFLQEFYLIALDVFAQSEYAKVKKPKDRLNGWLSFFCTENTEDAVRLCETYPWLSEPYKEMARFAANPEELMGMFSEMLHELDRNTTRYMVDDMKEKIEQQGKTIVKLQGTVTAQREALAEKDMALASRDGTITEQQRTISEQKAALEAMETEIKRLMENQTTFNQD
ncbi:MAG: PD-(D/E)XK nuclease family transposase, partial [Lachnospiraceae bacterium]